MNDGKEGKDRLKSPRRMLRSGKQYLFWMRKEGIKHGRKARHVKKKDVQKMEGGREKEHTRRSAV